MNGTVKVRDIRRRKIIFNVSFLYQEVKVNNEIKVKIFYFFDL